MNKTNHPDLDVNSRDLTRLYVLTEMYSPEQTSTGYLLTKTAEGLATSFKTVVVTGPATNFLSPVAAPSCEMLNEVKIHRCWGASFGKDRILGRLVNMVTRSAAMFFKALLVCKRNSVCLVVTNPPLLPFFTFLVCRLKGLKMVLLIHDVYPEAIIAAGMASKESTFMRFLSRLNRGLYRQCAGIISLGRDMTSLAEAKLGGRDIPIYTIPNWAELDLIAPSPRKSNPMLKELGICAKFTFLYAGNMGRTHGIEYLVDAAEALKKEQDVHFIFLGFGAKKDWLVAQRSERELENVTVLPPKPRDEQPVFLGACDVAIISFVPGMVGVSVPSRMYNQMAAGRPILAIAEESSELARVVREEAIGWVVEPGDVEGLINTCRRITSSPEICKEMGARAAEVAQRKYSFNEAIVAYSNALQEVASNS